MGIMGVVCVFLIRVYSNNAGNCMCVGIELGMYMQVCTGRDKHV